MLHVFIDVGSPPTLLFQIYGIHIYTLTQTDIIIIEAEYFLLVVLGDIGKSMPELFKGAMRKDETV